MLLMLTLARAPSGHHTEGGTGAICVRAADIVRIAPATVTDAEGRWGYARDNGAVVYVEDGRRESRILVAERPEAIMAQLAGAPAAAQGGAADDPFGDRAWLAARRGRHV